MTGLKKNSITLFGAVASTCAFMGPATSIYFNTGMGVENSGNAFGFAFLLATIATLFIAYVIAQFAKKLPTSGFAYTFAVRGLGPKSGFLTGWLLVGGYAMICPMLLAGTGYFLSQFFLTYFNVHISWGIFAVIVGAAILLLSSMGVAQSVRVALIMLLIEICVMFAFFITVLIHGGAEGITFATFNPTNTLKPHDINGIGTAVMWAILMFVGFESAATLGEETKDAKRNIPKALIYCVVSIGAFYLIGAFTAVIGYGPSHVNEIVKGIASGVNPWDSIFETHWGKAASMIMMLVVLNSIFANLLSGFNATVRIFYAMGRENVLPKFMGEVSVKSQVPLKASIFYMSISLVATLILGYLWDPMTVYGWAGTILGLAIIIVYILINISLFFFYKRHTSEFNIVKHAVVPLVATVLLYLPLKGVIQSTLPSSGAASPMTSVPYIVAIWMVVGVIYTYYLLKYKKNTFESMGKVFEM
jgi:amino acid transporter